MVEKTDAVFLRAGEDVKKCKICGDAVVHEEEDACTDDNICESCFHDSFDSLDLEDKLEILLQ